MFISQKPISLVVPFSDKQAVKDLGALPYYENGTFKTWYIPPGVDILPFRRWWGEKLKRHYEDAVAKQGLQLSSKDEPIAPSGECSKPNAGVGLGSFLTEIGKAVQVIPSRWVFFEIASVSPSAKISSVGHVYFEAVEKNAHGVVIAKARLNLWNGNRAELKKFYDATQIELAAGIKVLAFIEPSFKPEFGLSFVIKTIEPSFTIGEAERHLRELRQRLVTEGLLNRNKSFQVPHFIQNVAVISPGSAAGLGDFLSVTEKLKGVVNIEFFSSAFQGANLINEFCAAVDNVLLRHSQLKHDNLVGFDVVVIIRGGGDTTGLMELNNYEIAKRVCVMPIPVIVGIGHERDNSIMDEIACVRCATPSLAATFLIDNTRGFLSESVFIAQKIKQMLNQLVESTRYQTDTLTTKMLTLAQQQTLQARQLASNSIAILYNAPLLITGQTKNTLDNQVSTITVRAQGVIANQLDCTNRLTQSILNSARQSLQSSESHRKLLTQQILGQNPVAVLSRGYALISKGQHFLTTVETVEINDQLTITMSNGQINVDVKEITHGVSDESLQYFTDTDK